MITLKDIRQCNNIHNIPNEIYCNKGIRLDFRLVETFENGEKKEYQKGIKLSAGQKQRLNLIRGILIDKDLLSPEDVNSTNGISQINESKDKKIIILDGVTHDIFRSKELDNLTNIIKEFLDK